MSEIGEVFAALHQRNKLKKESNKEKSTRLLTERGIPFISKRFGTYLIVSGCTSLIDFWPSTGKFISRDGTAKGRGVFNLLKLCKESKE